MAGGLLRLQTVSVYVRDQDRSLDFYTSRLGFKLIVDTFLPDGGRWVAVGPPDGRAMLALIAPPADSKECKLIGRDTGVVFLAEDVPARVAEWQLQGIRFDQVPFIPKWGGTFGTFEDVDGNSFGLVGYDEATRRIEEERRAEAEKGEAEQRAAQELAIAQQVQARLFPQSKPQAGQLDYSGACIQARIVGGDYYDFLSLGPGRLGLVIGDIAGKGIAGALLMANLQANLRSQCANAYDQPIERLPFVNRLFYENTGDASYATLLFAEYDTESQSLCYANCGHLPGLVLRRDGEVERLEPTCTVLGLFKEWECGSGDIAFLPGDLLLLYTDGVTEAANEAGEDFGEDRLTEALRRHRALPPEGIIAEIVKDLRDFAGSEQQDDITLIVAKSV